VGDLIAPNGHQHARIPPADFLRLFENAPFHG
jgi:hypothetical protein